MIPYTKNSAYYKRTYAKKCSYKGIDFDSKMEMDFAMFLDGNILRYKNVNYYHKPIKWEREKYKFAIIPRKYLFNVETGEYEFIDDYIYTPDFYIPSLNKFIEIKGFSGDTPEWKLRKHLFLNKFSSSINFYTIYHHEDFEKFETHSESLVMYNDNNIVKNNDNKKGCVYMHSFPNGKVYIGKTTQTPSARWQCGKGYPKKYNPYLYNAIEKYGWDNVENIILKSDLTPQEMNDYEKYYINKYKSNNFDFGYNLTRGGDYYLNDMKNISNQCRPIICYETLTIYSSPMEVEKAFNINNICSICDGYENINHYAKGYHWWYFDEFVKLSNQEIENIINLEYNLCKIKCLTNGKTYNNYLEATKELNLTKSMIIYSYNNNVEVGVKYITKHYEFLNKSNQQKKKIRVIEDNLIFDTYKEIQEKYGISLSTIKKDEDKQEFKIIDTNSGYLFEKV